MFRSLANANYRIWFAGALVSNVGTWMQRTAQDWVVLTQLTNNNATAVGVVMAMQFGPQLVLLPVTGWFADRFDRQRLLIATQAAMGTIGLLLGILSVTGTLQLWHVYALALALGCASAIDAPARQTFVTALVKSDDLGNAVGLNSASFQGARLIGPALAGLLTAVIGAGWVFLLNAATFAGVIVSLTRIRVPDSERRRDRAGQGKVGLLDGFRYVGRRPDIIAILIAVTLVGTFGLNFPIFVATMSTQIFHVGAGEYGILSSIMAIGSLIGALLAARRDRPKLRLVFGGATLFGVALAIAALMPWYGLFAAVLVVVGLASMTFMTNANSTIQLTTDPAMRGRVMAIYFAIFMGGTPIGAPIVGWVADAAGPRWAMMVGAAAGLIAGGVGLWYLMWARRQAREAVPPMTGGIPVAVPDVPSEE